jgi:DNA repair protein RadC
MSVRFEPIVGRYMHLELSGRAHRIYLEEAGAGTPLLCLHTAGSDGRQYRGLMNDARVTRNHRVIAFEELFRGTIDGASVHPREVVRRCLSHNAAAMILAHNHPSGVAEPSAADRAITLRLRDAMELIDVRLLDHFVIGHGTPTSLAQRGWL